MPSFTYVARDQQGIAHAGQVDGPNEDDVVALLQHRGLLVTSISRKDLEQERRLVFRNTDRRFHLRVTLDDQVLLCQELTTMLEAGVPLLRSLEVVAEQVESRKLLRALEQVYRDVRAGSTFRGALAKHPAIFSKLWLNLVETGEASGHLAQSLKQLARHFESSRHLQEQAKTALTYPMFLMLVGVIVVGIFVYWLIPKFSVLFASLHGMRLPLMTRLLIALSEAARKYVIVVILGVFGVGFSLRQYLRTETGQWMRDRILLGLPLIRRMTVYIQIAEFSRGLHTLLESGVPLLSSLEILGESATNKIYGKAVLRVRSRVEEGKAMAEQLAETGYFPPIVVQMVQVGEEIGELAKMAERVAKYYEERVETYITRMTRLFEPIAIVVMAVVVLGIVLSIFMPIFQMSSGAGARG